MVFAFNGLTGSTVTITGGSGVIIPNTSQTIKKAFAVGTGASATLYTPTAGKTFYLLGINQAGAGSGSFYDQDGTTEIFRTTVNGIYAFVNPLATYDNTHPLKFNIAATAYITAWGVEV